MSGSDGGLLLSGATLSTGQVADVRLEDARIAEVGAPGGVGTAAEWLDLTGFVLLPAPGEPTPTWTPP